VDSSLLAVTVIGNDRPGIVAGVTRVLFEKGCNLEDATSTILRGHFAMMLVVRAPANTRAAALEEALSEAGAEMGLVITVRPVEEAALETAESTHMVAVYGADRPGIVFKVTDLLARRGASITALNSRVIGSEDNPVYALMLEVALPEGADVNEDLDRVREELDVEVTMHPIEADVL
jgi:glycine cleavage system transcriptional repressor